MNLSLKKQRVIVFLLLLFLTFILFIGIKFLLPQNQTLKKLQNYSSSISPTAPPNSSSIRQINAHSFALGIRIDPQTLDFWNQYALPTDFAQSREENISYLIKIHLLMKALEFLDVSDTQHAISLAKANGINALFFNKEKTQDCLLLLTDETTAVNQIKQAGLQFIFVPTGFMMRKCYQQYPKMIMQTDSIIYQTESIQGVDQSYATDVKTMVQNIKKIKPGIPVWVQVSVNPPENRSLDAQSVISTINSIEDGTSGNPEGIQIFYDLHDNPDRISTMEQVVKAFRIAH